VPRHKGFSGRLCTAFQRSSGHPDQFGVVFELKESQQMRKILIPLCAAVVSTCLSAQDKEQSAIERLAAIRKIEDDKRRLLEYDRLAIELTGSDEQKELIKKLDFKRWQFNRVVDPIDDSISTHLMLQSEGSEALLNVIKKGEKLTVYVATKNRVDKGDKIVFRVDKRKAETQNWFAHVATVMHNKPEDFLASLKGGKELLIKVGIELYRFNIEGVDENVAKLNGKGGK